MSWVYLGIGGLMVAGVIVRDTEWFKNYWYGPKPEYGKEYTINEFITMRMPYKKMLVETHPCVQPIEWVTNLGEHGGYQFDPALVPPYTRRMELWSNGTIHAILDQTSLKIMNELK